MRLLHTSDWHLGQNFMGKSREEEHKAFFKWLIELINRENIDTLIVAGDIFDISSPPNYALELYYNFLKELKNSNCKNIVIIAGNHDSIATLKASRELLKMLNIYVIASGDDSEDKIIPIKSGNTLEAIICAVPFLRDSVIRKSESFLKHEDKEMALNVALKEYYASIYKEAKAISKDVPIVATGHFTTVGSKSSESEREIYIGNMLNISSDFLAKRFDYTALGHLHINQQVGESSVYYSGSPIALSFSEAKSKKFVNIVEFNKKVPKVELVEVPRFQNLIRLSGDLESLKEELKEIEDKSSWIEITLKDDNINLATRELFEYAKELNLEILAIKVDKTINPIFAKDMKVSSLNELKPIDIFKKRLEFESLDKGLEDTLIDRFKRVLDEVNR